MAQPQGGIEEGIVQYRVKRLAEMAGIRETLKGQVRYLTATLETSSSRLTEEQQQTLKALLAEVFVVDTLYQEALQRITAGYDAEKVVALTEWLLSAEAQAFHKQQRDAMHATEEAWNRFYGGLDTNAAAQARRPAIERLDAAMGATRQAADASVQLAAAVYQSSLLEKMDAHPSLHDGEQAEALIRKMTDAHLAEITPQIEAQYAAAVPTSLLFAFREATDAQLEGWIAFFESENGRWYTDVLLAAVNDAFAGAVQRFGRDLARRMARPSPQGP